MSVYEFEHPNTGKRVEREFPIGKAPPSITVNGIEWPRAISAPALIIDTERVQNKPIGFASSSIDPRDYKFHKGEFKRNEHGQREPIFGSRREIREFEERSAAAGRPYKYGGSAVEQWNENGKRRAAKERELGQRNDTGRIIRPGGYQPQQRGGARGGKARVHAHAVAGKAGRSGSARSTS